MMKDLIPLIKSNQGSHSCLTERRHPRVKKTRKLRLPNPAVDRSKVTLVGWLPKYMAYSGASTMYVTDDLGLTTREPDMTQQILLAIKSAYGTTPENALLQTTCRIAAPPHCDSLFNLAKRQRPRVPLRFRPLEAASLVRRRPRDTSPFRNC